MTDPEPGPSKIIPNSYQSPNFLVDVVMRLLSGNEQKCVDAICRKTFGWQKRTDRISKSQLVALTGLGENTVDTCMATLVKFRVVLRVSESMGNKGVEWGIQTDDAKIDLAGLGVRDDKRRVISATKVAAAHEKRQRGDDEHTPHDQQPPRGDDEHTPQKPLSKANTTTTAAENPKFGALVRGMEGITGAVNPSMVSTLTGWLEFWEEHAVALPVGHPDKGLDPYGVVLAAIREGIDSVDDRRPSNKYIEAILRRWCREGYRSRRQHGNGSKPNGRERGGEAAPTDADRERAKRVKRRKQESVS